MRPVQQKVLPRSMSEGEESVSNSVKADKIVLGNSADKNDDGGPHNTQQSPRFSEYHESYDSVKLTTDPVVDAPIVIKPQPRPPSNQAKNSERSLSFMHRSTKSDSGNMKLQLLRQTDVFDIEEQSKLLSEDLEKTKLARKGNNAYSRKKSLWRRLISCNCLRSPGFMSSEQIYEVAKTGDLFFDRQGSTFEGQRLPFDIIRGIRSTVDGKYIPKKRELQLWTRVSFVVCVSPLANRSSHRTQRRMSWAGRPEETPASTKYLLFADNRGLRIRSLHDTLSADELSACQTYMNDNRYISALRPIVVKSSGVSIYCHYADGLEEIVALCVEQGGFLPWGALQTPDRHSPRAHSPSVEPSRNPLTRTDSRFSVGGMDSSSSAYCFDDALLASVSPWMTSFASSFFRRLHSVSFKPSAESLAEATRCFHLIAANFAQHNPEHVLAKSSSKGHGSREEAADGNKLLGALGRSMSGKDGEQVPTDFLRGHLAAMLQRGGQTGSTVGDEHFDQRLQEMLTHMDEDNDGAISLIEFLDAFCFLPCDEVPLEFDFPAVSSGEMVASALVQLRVLSESALKDHVFFHPESFSSAAKRSTVTAANSAGGKTELKLKNMKHCAVVTTSSLESEGVKFGNDILLKVNG